MTGPPRVAVVGRDVRHAPGDARDWRLRLPVCHRLEAPGGGRALTASVLWAAWRQGVPAVAVRSAGGAWRTHSPAGLLAGRLIRRGRTMAPGAASRAWARLLAVPLPPAGRAEGPLVIVLPSLAGNGAERQMLHLVRGLVARGWPVRVLVKHLRDRPGADALAPDLARLGVPVTVWTEPPPTRHPALARLERAAVGLPDALAGDALAVAGWLAHLQPRAVHAWLEGTAVCAGVAAAALGVPRVLVGLRNRAPDVMGHPLAAPLRPGLRALADHPAVTLIANAEAVAADHIRWAGLAESPTVIPNGVAPLPRSHPKGSPLLLGVFRLVAHKRPLLWLEVAARVRAARPDVRLRLLGAGPLKDEVAARAQGLALPLEAPGRVADVAPHLAEASVLLHVSAAEGLANAVLEADAAGVPVVATAAGGLAAHLGAAAVDPPDPAALAARVLALLDDPAARAQAVSEGRARVGPLTLAAMVARHESLYESPPRAPDEAAWLARHRRRSPRGLAERGVTLLRLLALGQGAEIARRLGVGGCSVERVGSEGATGLVSPEGRGREGRAAPRLACIGETLARDGAPLSLLELASGLGVRGTVRPAVVLSLHAGPLAEGWRAAGWPVRLVSARKPLVPTQVDQLAARFANSLSESGAEVALVNGVRAFAGVAAARRLGLRVVWMIREPGPEALADLSRTVRAGALSLLAAADEVVFVSRATRAAWAPWIAGARARVIDNALPPARAAAPYQRAPGERVILAAGPLCPRKAPLDLIGAWALLPDDLAQRSRLVWVGRDSEGYGRRLRAALARLPEDRRARLTVLDECADMAPLWAGADVAVCPSHAEAAPRVVLEAIRAGLPLVATAVGGIPAQAARWPASWLVPPGDPPALARALAAALRVPRPEPPGDTAARFESMLDAYAAVLRGAEATP
jgi:glycosyltransferase involved in cell wall biosynthesis